MSKSLVMPPERVRRTLSRLAHEIIERNQGTSGIALIGLQRGGVWLAEALGDAANPFFDATKTIDPPTP